MNGRKIPSPGHRITGEVDSFVCINISFWVVATQLFFGIFHPKNWGRLIDYHFDDHIFQMGWVAKNHQPAPWMLRACTFDPGNSRLHRSRPSCHRARQGGDDKRVGSIPLIHGGGHAKLWETYEFIWICMNLYHSHLHFVLWFIYNCYQFIYFTYAFCTVIHTIYINLHTSHAFHIISWFHWDFPICTRDLFGSQMTKNPPEAKNKSNHGWLAVSALATLGLLFSTFSQLFGVTNTVGGRNPAPVDR